MALQMSSRAAAPAVARAAHSCAAGDRCSLLGEQDTFARRHIGPRDEEVPQMLQMINKNYRTLDDLSNAAIPPSIQTKGKRMDVGEGRGEQELLDELLAIARENKTFKSFIGQGYYGTITPQVILRNVLQNPSWYTPYTPYQAEVSQGRLEAMLAYQTVVSDLTGMDISTCSLLDEATAGAEAMRMCQLHVKSKSPAFFVSSGVHRQVTDVIRTRSGPLGIEVIEGDAASFDFGSLRGRLVGALVQYPDTFGTVEDYTDVTKRVHDAGALMVASADLLALTMLREPSTFGADVVIGSSGRFGCPMGFGGPHAGFLATRDELKRVMPGRIIGLSKDVSGKPAYRMALQTREQHIRREKASSNICTAAALMAQVAAFYSMYHGPKGLRAIAQGVHAKACILAEGLKRRGIDIKSGAFFDTIVVELGSESAAKEVHHRARDAQMNLRDLGCSVGVSLDETTTLCDVARLIEVISGQPCTSVEDLVKSVGAADFCDALRRKTPYLQHPTFNRYHSETEMMRYLRRLNVKDVGLDTAMIPLGSCTMKLNAASVMAPMTWPEFANVHPFAPEDQVQGYIKMIKGLENDLCQITGFSGCSLQPNSGAAGEYAGLMTIRSYLRANGQGHRDICLIPISAHGTNPASSALAGLKPVIIACDHNGNIDLEDLKKKAREHKDKLAAIMMTYPSTHGVYEDTFKEAAEVVHSYGGCVYMDGANMNAQVGLIKPVELGADVCHLNLHKTFAIPHGGGGPGIGPICANEKLAPYMPGHSCRDVGMRASGHSGAVSAAPYGSADALPLSWMYARMLGTPGLKKATQAAILNANYMAARLKPYYKILYTGPNGLVAHEFILDLRPFKPAVEAEDVAKRLVDYGFHAPTMSFPVPGTLMVEPTESESLQELDRFCDAMIAIRREIDAVVKGDYDRVDNPLKNAPHTVEELVSDSWMHKYPREVAAFPVRSLRAASGAKYFATCKRVDNQWGDLNLYATFPHADCC
uniref:Glycine cleavage system P protein n=1 Tax=Mastigamoeba balamuthi TaxID=108607 RepID=A0A0B5D558_MASBA|nr:mitochondrial glycine cleavage system P protein [Mastigamoeba balamuthi]|eukprot:m51a1_g6700 putative glycine dehydrogenase (988) ;mRNA; f:92429-95854